MLASLSAEDFPELMTESCVKQTVECPFGCEYECPLMAAEMTVDRRRADRAVVIRAPQLRQWMCVRAAAKLHPGRLDIFDLLAAEERDPSGAALVSGAIDHQFVTRAASESMY